MTPDEIIQWIEARRGSLSRTDSVWIAMAFIESGSNVYRSFTGRASTAVKAIERVEAQIAAIIECGCGVMADARDADA